MRIAFTILLILHAFIHLIGFVKAFDLAQIKQLNNLISKPLGLLWLLACILLLTTAFMYLFKNNDWYVPGIAGLLISQILIISQWHDAKFGILVNLILLLLIIMAYGVNNFYNQYKSDVTLNLSHVHPVDSAVLNEDDIDHLPEVVKKYIRYSGCIGQAKVNNFKVSFTGNIRANEQSAWMPFTSTQYNFMQTPTRLFFLNATMKHLPVAGYHRFIHGIASMDIRLLSLFKVEYQAGGKMNQSETVTFFNDMCCLAPATLIDSRIQWLEKNGNDVCASFSNQGITIKAWLYFNDTGELINFISTDRYSFDAGKILPWSPPLHDYKQIGTHKLMSKAETVYSYPERQECYGTFQLNSVEYNCDAFN